MPVGDRQKLITDIVASILGEPAHPSKTFEWFINKHLKDHFGNQYSTID